jgi:nucleoside-diphosphate-sugar epimerase
MPGLPKLYFGVVDVRDVADQHIRAMTNPAARGERFLSVGGDFVRLIDIATILKRRLGEAARRVPARELPNWLVRLAALRDSGVRQFVPELGKVRNATNEKARRLLDWSPRSNEDAVVATAESLLRLGLLRNAS